jgi:glutamine synthetase
VLEAGLDGIENRRDPGRPLDENVYEKPQLASQHKLPENLLDALRNFEKCSVLRQGLGEEFSTAYLKLKQAEWRDYNSHVSAWEKDRTLDC